MKSFVDITQKEATIRARLGALQKLSEYYQSALKVLDIRIKAVVNNTEALIQGIHIIDIPGNNLDLIIKGTSP